MLHRIAQTLREHALLAPGQRVLVAISGGPDSVALAAALRMLGHDLVLAHVNYGLRGTDSDADEALVRAYAQDWQVQLRVKRFNTKALLAAQPEETLQTLARKLRYAFFEEVMQAEGLTVCALGHHADDQAETLLMRLLRGNSPHVLQGIPIRRGPYVRPLLEVTRQQILQFCEDQQLTWRQDASNNQNDYLRNRLRNEVMPLLKAIQPDLPAVLADKYHWYQQQEAALNQGFSARYDREVTQSGETLAWGPAVPDAPMAAYVLERWGLHGHALWAGLQLLDSQPGAWISVATGLKLARTRNGLLLFPETAVPQPVTIPGPESLPMVVGEWQISLAAPETQEALRQPNTYFLDLEAITFPLVIRPWQQGDRMQPLGMQHGSKLLSDIMADAHWNPAQKQQALVVADAQGVVCLTGFRVSERVKYRALHKPALLMRLSGHSPLLD